MFPDLEKSKTGVSKPAAVWFASYLRVTCGIKSREKTFHSLRHSFATFAERSELRDEHILSLLGHSWGSTVLRKKYARELDVREKHTHLHTIRFPPIQMTPHRPERYARYFKRARAEQTRKARLDAAYGVAPSQANPRPV